MAQAIPLILTAATTAVAYVGAKRQAAAQEQAADYNAEVAEQNADIAREQAALRAEQIDRENRLRLGATRAAAGASGISSGAGTVIDVVGDLVTQGELQRQEALYEGELRARGFTIDRDLSRSRARGARSAGRISAATALLQGGTQMAQQGQALRVGGGG